MPNERQLSYPGFLVSFLVPVSHDEDEIDRAIAKIKDDVAIIAGKHLPAGCSVDLEDTV